MAKDISGILTAAWRIGIVDDFMIIKCEYEFCSCSLIHHPASHCFSLPTLAVFKDTNITLFVVIVLDLPNLNVYPIELSFIEVMVVAINIHCYISYLVSLVVL